MLNNNHSPEPKNEDLQDQVSEDGDDFGLTGSEEIGGVNGPEPTRFGDWEKNGRCIDF